MMPLHPMDEDRRQRAFQRHQHARRVFIEMAAPYQREIANIRMLFGRPVITFDAVAGSVIESKLELPEDAQRWIAQIEKIIDQLLELAVRDAEALFP